MRENIARGIPPVIRGYSLWSALAIATACACSPNIELRYLRQGKLNAQSVGREKDVCHSSINNQTALGLFYNVSFPGLKLLNRLIQVI